MKFSIMLYRPSINIVNKFLFIPTNDLLVIILSIAIIGLMAILVYKKMRKYNFTINEMKYQNEQLQELYDNALSSNKQLGEEVVYEKQKNTNLISKVNREINNSVNGIMGMANLLKDTELTTEQEKNAIAIVDCSEKLLQNTQNIFNSNNLTEVDNIKSIKTKITHQPLEKMASKPVSPEFANEFPLKILIAEDDTINQHLAVRVLNKLGYKPDVVSNGKEALEIVSEKNYDLILMDGLMPEMDGFEATRMIRLCLEIQPVIIALTASTMYGDKEKCIQAGMNDYISKPLIIGELAATLEKWATEKRAVS